MIVAFDYDATYTLDPILWDEIIKLMLKVNHTVICVTARPEIMGQEVLDSIGQLVPVLFAGGEWKREYALKHGYHVDVWIEDSPEYVGPQLLIGTK